jgi:predicted small lipoprotein YifL
MKARNIMLVAAAFALAACGRTKDGDLTVERPGDVDVDVTSTQDTIKLPDVGTRIDTINTPTVGTKPETLIVNKPVVGTKKTEVKVPTIKKPPV